MSNVFIIIDELTLLKTVLFTKN